MPLRVTLRLAGWAVLVLALLGSTDYRTDEACPWPAEQAQQESMARQEGIAARLEAAATRLELLTPRRPAATTTGGDP